MIYILEDDASIRKLVVYTIQSQGMEAEGFERPSQFWEALERRTPDLLLLDIMLPDEDGLQVLKRLRSLPVSRSLPVILLTAKSTEYDKVLGLDEGADDYVVKPFNIRELLLRIRAILRRQVMVESNPVLTRHGVSVDPAAHKVTVLGEDVELTATEFRLIEDLLRNAGRVRTREGLRAAVWGYQFEGYARTVDTHIRRLRNKLGDAAEIIETVRGVGYRCKE